MVLVKFWTASSSLRNGTFLIVVKTFSASQNKFWYFCDPGVLNTASKSFYSRGSWMPLQYLWWNANWMAHVENLFHKWWPSITSVGLLKEIGFWQRSWEKIIPIYFRPYFVAPRPAELTSLQVSTKKSTWDERRLHLEGGCEVNVARGWVTFDPIRVHFKTFPELLSNCPLICSLKPCVAGSLHPLIVTYYFLPLRSVFLLPSWFFVLYSFCFPSIC